MPNPTLDNKFKKFLNVKSTRDLADVLEIKFKHLIYYAYILAPEKKYKEFQIKKRNGGIRNITSPVSQMKLIQRRINDIMQVGFKHKACIHGFVNKRSIVSNASQHIHKKIIVNLDLKNFFPSINFGRVRGMFMARPFHFDNSVASILANLCCYKNSLPQGAPSSPVISNYICRRLDNELLSVCLRNRITYSRYADDLTFSTSLSSLPAEIATIADNEIILSERITNIISNNGFVINPSKMRFAKRMNRQEVTGLITNTKVNVKRTYIRHIRAMLHAWEKFGIDLAASEHFEKYNYKNKSVGDSNISFVKELAGKIGFVGFVKGKDDLIYQNFVRKINELAPEIKLSIIRKDIQNENLPLIYGEGKTDWKHLKAALSALQLKKQYINLNIGFSEYSDKLNMGSSELLMICRTLSKFNVNKNPVICLFDRDEKFIIAKVSETGSNFKHWGNRVYSLLLQKPPHRNFDEVCIEHYYLDTEIKTLDKNNRRLFLSDEFDKLSGNHLTEPVFYTIIKKLQTAWPFIIDHSVNNSRGENVALPKNDFASSVLSKKEKFDVFTFEYFHLIFKDIQSILDYDKLNRNR